MSLLDDKKARRIAREWGLPMSGSIGVLLEMKQEGVIPATRPVMEKPLRGGIYYAPPLIEHALHEVGEVT